MMYLYRAKLCLVVNKNAKLTMKRIGILICCMGLLVFRVQAQQINTTPTVTTQQVDNSVKISYANSMIKVSNAPVNSKLEIYNILGSKVTEIEMKESSGEYQVSLSKGFYVAHIEGIARKIVIR